MAVKKDMIRQQRQKLRSRSLVAKDALVVIGGVYWGFFPDLPTHNQGFLTTLPTIGNTVLGHFSAVETLLPPHRPAKMAHTNICAHRPKFLTWLLSSFPRKQGWIRPAAGQ